MTKRYWFFHLPEAGYNRDAETIEVLHVEMEKAFVENRMLAFRALAHAIDTLDARVEASAKREWTDSEIRDAQRAGR